MRNPGSPGLRQSNRSGGWAFQIRLVAALAATLCCCVQAAESQPLNLVVACRAENDLLRILAAQEYEVLRVDSASDAVARAPEEAGVLILADEYPERPVALDAAVFDMAAQKKLRLYMEYPSYLPDLELGPPRRTEWERAVVASDRFAPGLEKLRILAIHGCRFLPVAAEEPHIVLARVAGFDTAVYGLPEEAHPILFEHPSGNILVATTKLSQFVTARYAPTDAWQTIWKWILDWVDNGETSVSLEWTPTVRPSFARNDRLPIDVAERALRRGVQWFFNAKLFPHGSWEDDRSSYKDLVGPEAEAGWTLGDGSQGMLEGFNAAIHHDGSQHVRWWLRNDCMGEGTMALAFDAILNDDQRSRSTALNLGDFIFFDSEITKGPRDDPDSPSFGLMSWDINQSLGVFYGDDNARSMLGTLACAALLDVDRWDEKTLRCMLANLRTTGPLGFRAARIDEKPLHARGWRHYLEQPRKHYSPHYQAYLWACFLWAYHQTRYEPFLERTKTAIRMTMDAYPDDWRWTNGLQQERARILLPLAWLVRVEDTTEHRQWLRRIAQDLLALQDSCGAIREELGSTGKGSYAPPASNEAYGTAEAPLIQENGDPLCDLLYTTNFAFLGLHEAAAATGEDFYAEAEDRLAKFLCRIQIRSETHPELDGGWFRAFDFRRWEYWASSADLGWGAWSIESGWTCGWINAVLGMRRLETSLWDITADSTIERHFDALHALLLGEDHELSAN
jgi:hypothetical protein